MMLVAWNFGRGSIGNVAIMNTIVLSVLYVLVSNCSTFSNASSVICPLKILFGSNKVASLILLLFSPLNGEVIRERREQTETVKCQRYS